MANQEVEIFFKVEGVDGYITDLNELSDALQGVAKEQKEVNDEIEETGKASKKGGGFLTQLGKRGKAAFGVLKGAIAATGIGLLLTAFAQLIEFFKKTDTGAKILQGATAAVGVVFENIFNLVMSLGGPLQKLFENPLESLKNFGKAIIDNIVTRFEGILELIPNLGKAIGELFRGNFSEAGKIATDAVAKVTLGVEDFSDKAVAAFDTAVEAVTKVVNEVQVAITTTNNLIDATNTFAALQNRLIVQNAELTKELEEQKKISEDTTRSYDERSEALEKVIEANEQLVENALLEAQETEKLLQAKLAVTKNDEDRRELEAELANATAERIAREQEASIVELESAQLRRELDQEEVDRKKAINDTIEGLRIENIEDEKTAQLAALELAEQTLLAELELLRATEEQKQAVREQFDEKRRKVEEDFAEDSVELAKTEAEKRQQIADKAFSVLNDLYTIFAKTDEENAEKNFKTQKAIGIAQAAINTGLAVTAALTAGGNPIKLATGAQFVEAGIAAAAGAAQIAAIARTKFEGGTQGGPPPPNVSAGQTPQFTTPNQIQGGPGADLDITARQNEQPQPIQAYVIASDVTSAQQANQQIENLSRL